MGGDWNDLTDRSNKDGKYNRTIHRLVIPGLLAGSFGLYLFDGPGGLGPRGVSAEEQSLVAQPLVDQESGPSQPTAEMIFWEQVERDRERGNTTSPLQQELKETDRQTRFNDLNYTPPKQVNIIQSVPVRSSGRSAGGGRQTLAGSKSVTVRWVDARGNQSSWRTRFEYRDGRIDNSSFCLNIGKGSIPYRECRKGARQWLKVQCRTDRSISDEWRKMYCWAHGSYRT